MSFTTEKEAGNYLYVGECLTETATLEKLERLLCFKGGKIFQTIDDPEGEARVIVENKNIKVLLIDQYLISGSGIDLMLWMNEFTSIPTILIIMSNLSIDVVVALEAGAVDAVYAGIDPRELAARVHVASRNNSRSISAKYPITQQEQVPYVSDKTKSPLYYISDKKWLYFSDSTRVALHGKEADLMELLIARHPNYINRDEISKIIFNREWHPSDRSIDNLISRLRKVIDPSEFSHNDSSIETIRNGGYRLRFPIVIMPVENNIAHLPGIANKPISK